MIAAIQRAFLLQVAERQLGAEAPSFSAIGRRLIREQGVRGLWKGVAPRLMNVALWVRALPRPLRVQFKDAFL